VFENRLGAGLV